MQSSGVTAKVAVYCRVSTDREDQRNSLKSQKEYFTRYIAQNPLWSFSGLYVDEGISGTSVRKRAAFNQMMADAETGRFDLIVTKEISRFARNTLDSIFYTRKLKELGVGVFFLSDNINTLDADAELRLTILSSIAQEESRKISERVKWGQKRRMEQGVVFGRNLLGYNVTGGQMTVDEEGAKIVRHIFHKFVREHKGAHTIARELLEANVPTCGGSGRWSNTAVLRILRNEKYKGDLVQKKTYTPDYLTHAKKNNDGKEERVVSIRHHEPIIDPDLFDLASRELARRREKQKKGRHSGRYCFSGKLTCALCGQHLVSRVRPQRDGVQQFWRCYQAVRYGGKIRLDSRGNPVGCPGGQIPNADLLLVLSEILKALPLDREAVLAPLFSTLQPVFAPEWKKEQRKKLEGKLQKLVDKRRRLIDLFLGEAVTQVEFDRLREKYEREEESLKAEKNRQEEGEAPFSSSPGPQALCSWADTVLKGELVDEIFYRAILDFILVHSPTLVEVKLAFSPRVWRAEILPVKKGLSF